MKNWNHLLIPLREKLQALASDRKSLLLIGGCTAGILLLVLLLVMLIRINHNQDEMRRTSRGENRLLMPQAITQEEIFPPHEPDFLPEVLLDREPRSSWTDEDAEQFWNDPLNENPDVWKNRIIEAVDDLLENIP